MSNFNEYFKKKGLPIIIDKFFSGPSGWDGVNQVTNIKYHIEPEPDRPSSYYVENGLSAMHKVIISYDINNDGVERFTEFEIPKEVDGAFVIDGDYRVASTTLGNDYDCRMKFSGEGELSIHFDYNRDYLLKNKVLRILRINPDLGIDESSIEIPYELIDDAANDPAKKELLRLTPKQILKFKVKLDQDEIGEYITQKLIDDCIEFGDDRDLDLIVDKSIESVAQGFMQYLFYDNNRKNYTNIRYRMKNYFTKNGKIQEQSNAITSTCLKFWKGNCDATSKELVIPPGVNAVNLESIGSKITIKDTVAYNTTMSDLIDIADTPINQNTNLQNSLTVSTHITDEGVFFDVYDKNFNKITLEYLEYLNKKVVASEYVDYDNHLLRPTSDNKIEVKHRMKRKFVDKDDYDLIDMEPDYRLSETSRRIPFLNFTDSVRVSMGTSMAKQAIPLANAQRPLVDTGNKSELKSNVLNTRFDYPEGKVSEINEDFVIVKLPDGTTNSYERRTAIQSQNDVAVWIEPKVKVGQKVKQGDVLLGAHEIEDDTVKLGVNTLVLYSAYKGLVHEDAVVVSESYADRMTSYGIVDIFIDIKPSNSLKWIAPIGTVVKAKDPVVTLYKAVKLDDINQIMHDKLGSVVKDEEGKSLDNYTVFQNLLVPNNLEEAVVSDVMIQENVNPEVPKNSKRVDYTFARSSKKDVDEYMKNKDRKIIYQKFPEYIAADTLSPFEMDPEEYNKVYTIKIRLINIHRLLVADKLTNRYGGKGVISAILPDHEMPIVDGKHCELIMNPYSTINRKIPGVIMEASLGKIAYKIHDLVDDYKRTATGRKKIMPLVNKYYPGRFTKMDVDEFIKLHNSQPIEEVYYFNVGCFARKYTPETIQKMMDELDVKSSAEVYLPATDMTDLEELKNNLSEEEYNKIVESMKGEFKKVEKPLMAGYVTMEQLYHIPSYANKVTSDAASRGRNAVPVPPRGAYREEGQQIGEQELSALLSRNAKQFISAYRAGREKEQNQRFVDNLLALGLMIVDNKGYAQGGSSLKTSMMDMKKKLQNQKNAKGGIG